MRSPGRRSGTRRVAHLWLTAIALWAWSPSVVAAAPLFDRSTKVVLFTPPVADPLVARLEAELASVGIAVERLPLPAGAQLDAVVTRELGGGASAAIRIIPRSRGAEVWTGDATARVSSRSSKAATSDAVLSVIALRTVEFLRATLLDVKRRPVVAAVEGVTATAAGGETAARVPAPSTSTPAPALSPSESPPPPPTATERRSPVERPPAAAVEAPSVESRGTGERTSARTAAAAFQIAAGPAIVASPGGIMPMAAIAMIGRAPVVGRLGIELIGIFPVTSSHNQTADGAADTSIALFGAAAVLRLTPPHMRWSADVALGAAATWLRTSGSGNGGSATGAATAGYTKSVWCATGHLRFGGGYKFNRWLMVRGDALGGVVASRIEVSFWQPDASGTVVTPDPSKFAAFGSWGPAFAVGALSLQASW